jgi:predicted dehydrogenase
MVGYSFMGAAHSHAWRTAPRFFDLPLAPELTALAGRNADGVRTAAAKFGWDSVETDWRRLIERDDIDVIDICSPGNTHAEIAIAALEAGKHVLCEKPLANNVAEAELMTSVAAAAAAHGVYSMCGFTYRRTPAAQWITGHSITGVSALLETFVKERPIGGDFVGLGGRGGSDGPRGPVTVDDAAIFTARFGGKSPDALGPIGVFEATRFALGRKNALRLELNGTLGSLAFDFEDMNVLSHYDAADEPDAGFRRIMVTEPSHPYVGNWWPTGHGLGYEHGFTHQVVDFVNAIAEGQQPEPSFADALQVQKVLATVETSAQAESRWQEV